MNPYCEAIAPRKKMWKKRKEGLLINSMIKKEGNNGRGAKFFLDVSY